MKSIILAAIVISALAGQQQAFDRGMGAGVEYQSYFCKTSTNGATP